MKCLVCWMELDNYDEEAGMCYNCGRRVGVV